ncbi:STAS domain-containing protein [Planomonospora corallina]|uniref:Anti-sigma factor antagonist n=1 Tax=Planomonospora corallina TaxID=1806052 RepID=A0ABV8IGL5_9ACTN
MLFEPDRGSAFALSSGTHGDRGDHGDHGDTVVVHVSGELDYRSAPLLREHLDGVWGRSGVTVLVVDLSRVAFCDSVGLGELVTALQRSEAQGVRLMLSGVQGVLARVLSITGLRRAFEIHTDLGTALRRISGDGSPAQ